MDVNKQDAIVKKGPSSIVKSTEAVRVSAEPFADLFETGDGFILKIEVPGASKDSIKLKIEEGRLIIQAAAKDNTGFGAELIYSEIGLKNYFREFRLGVGIDLDNVHAGYGNGILTIALPKTEESKAREIKIN